MGNCVSESAQQTAILQDGQQNVIKTAILTQNQQFIQSFASQLKNQFTDEIKKKEQILRCQINIKKNYLKEIYENKKLQIQTKQPGKIQRLQLKYKQPFLYLSGYDQAMQKLQTFQLKSKQIHEQQIRKLLSEINAKKEQLRNNIEQQKIILPNLTSLGQSKKNKAFKHQLQKHKQQIQSSNQKVKQQLENSFDLEGIYLVRIQKQVPRVEIQSVVNYFVQNLQKNTAQTTVVMGCL